MWDSPESNMLDQIYVYVFPKVVTEYIDPQGEPHEVFLVVVITEEWVLSREHKARRALTSLSVRSNDCKLRSRGCRRLVVKQGIEDANKYIVQRQHGASA